MLRSALCSESSQGEVFLAMDKRMKCWKVNPVTVPAPTVLLKEYLQLED